NLRSRKTSAPPAWTMRTTSGPAWTKSCLPILYNPTASPRRRTARSAAATASTSRPTISRSRPRDSAGANELRNALDDLANGHLLRLARRARLQLDASLLQRTGADRDPRGDPDQVRVLELDAGPLVAVVEHRVHARGLEVHADALRRLAQRRI